MTRLFIQKSSNAVPAGFSPAGCRLVSALLLLGVSASGWARTIVMDAGNADRMAAIAESAPRLSWAGYEPFPAKYSSALIDLIQGRGFLIRFLLSDIPKGQRIIQAELVVPVNNYQGALSRFYLWRILADWGPGVCHLYRRVSLPNASHGLPSASHGPEKLEWTRPGARGYSSDRATRPSAIVRLNKKGAAAVNVTEDVELWYTGAAANNGWLFTVEDAGSRVQLQSPLGDRARAWKLRITYEPE